MTSPSHSSTSQDTEGGDSPRTFNTLALELQFLNIDQLSELTRAATNQGVPPEQMAQNLGLLTAAQLAILETLLHPYDAIPGYEILGLLGRGGMGVVYRARQKSLNRVVALKTVSVSDLSDATALQRFEQEAVTLARLTHPHIVAAYDFGKHRGRLFFAMEFVVGEDCDRFVRRHGPLTPGLAWGIIRQAASGLAHAAAAGIVHRDIKPANLLLLEPPVGFPLPKGIPLVKIADFGLAHLMAEGDVEERTRLTMNNATLGSPYYMAPEQLDGIDVDHSADIYALGISAWHLLGGHPPLAGKPLSQVMASKLAGEIPSLRTVRESISQDAVDLIQAMIRRRSSDRIRSYAEILRRIDALDLSHESISLTVDVEQPRENIHAVETMQLSRPGTGSVSRTEVGSAPPTAKARPARVRRRLIISAAVIGALVLSGAGYQTYVQWNRPGERVLVPSHESLFLFDGEDMLIWKALSGSWHIGKDDESSAVLVGSNGVIQRTVPKRIGGNANSPLEYYRLEMGARLHQAAAIELRFNLASSGASSEQSVVRLTAEGSQLGYRDGRSGPFIATSILHLYQHEPGDWHSIQIERQPTDWWVEVDNQVIGTVRARRKPPLREFHLAAEKGPAWFADVIVERLVRPGL